MTTVTIGMAGRVVMSEEEFEEWRSQQDTRGVASFYDALRREVARREQHANFRQLQLASDASDAFHLWQLPAGSTVVAVKRQLLLAEKGHGRLSIFSAARMDGVGTMIRLLEEPQDPNQADPHGGRSALSAAAFEGEHEVAQCLLEVGANVDEADREDALAFCCAAAPS
ncbi:unnamed protein product [Effrenium voratum]|uniref:Ankyrin repeat protein n=1 Tax=Effrenium voratum TaxID=2562239 RepID=A0AA36ISW9_9DINO|nr:unnamed protein product [Effrenium voratum]